MAEEGVTTIVEGAAPDTGAGEGATPPAGAPEAGGDQAPATPPADPEAAAAAAKAEGGDQSPGSEGKGDQSTEPTTDEIIIQTPEGMEAFQGDYDRYNSEASGWLKDNPDATAADALKWAAERQAELVKDQQTQSSENITQQIKDWDAEARNDKEFGGSKFDASFQNANKAVETWGSPEMRDLLDQTGLGSHPEFFKFCARAGAALAEGPVLNPSGGGAKKNFANAVYGDNS